MGFGLGFKVGRKWGGEGVGALETHVSQVCNGLVALGTNLLALVLDQSCMHTIPFFVVP